MSKVYVEKEAYGITAQSMEFVKEHLHLIGEVVRISGRLRGNKFDLPGREQWVVFSDKEGNKIVVSGFSWGYAGEGPHGLLRAAEMVGFPLTIELIAGLAQNQGWDIGKGGR